jgi:hypothetical protein
MATFAFSGLEHLLFNWYVTRTLYWPWLLFFLVHGGLLVAESAAARLTGWHKHETWPAMARMAATLAVLHGTACGMGFYIPLHHLFAAACPLRGR